MEGSDSPYGEAGPSISLLHIQFLWTGLSESAKRMYYILLIKENHCQSILTMDSGMLYLKKQHIFERGELYE